MTTTMRIGEPCRARCTAPGAYIGDGLCLFISAMDNDLAIDVVAGPRDWEWDAPLPSLRECAAAAVAVLYARHTTNERSIP